MPNSDVVASDLLAPRDAGALDPRTAPVPTSSGVVRSLLPGAELGRGLVLSDRQAAFAASAVLFVLAAWPMAFVEVPPFQDLPNHLAAVTVIEHPERYPEFAFNGFLKTNAALFAWLYVVGKVTGLKLAAKLFALVCLALNAIVLPRFVLTLTGSRRRMLVSTLFAWPMVHNWFVSMGMLDFALAVPLSLVMLLALEKQTRKPSFGNSALILGLGAITWYAHVFPLLVVHMLVLIEVLVQRTWKERFDRARKMMVLAPIAVLVVVSLGQHLGDTVGPMTGNVDYKKLLPAWELAYNMWAEWLWGFGFLQISTLVPCIGLALVGIWRRKDAVPFFSQWALLALALLYCFLPYIVTNWFHVNSRIIPFIWLAFLVRVPSRLPKKAIAVLALSAVAYTIGLGIDYFRLERDRIEFTAGIPHVPQGARLLPLLFKHKSGGENTRTILHAWGYYVTERQTAAPLLFAHSRSFPVMYSAPPPTRFNHLVLEGFASSMATPKKMCGSMFDGNMVVDDCDNIFRSTWSQFYQEALPRYDHLLVWDATPEGQAAIHPDYRLIFSQGRLSIYARKDVVAASPSPAGP
jgi:hypothetical protein